MRWDPFDSEFKSQYHWSQVYWPRFKDSLSNSWHALIGNIHPNKSQLQLGFIDYLTLGIPLLLLGFGHILYQSKIPIIDLIGGGISIAAMFLKFALTLAVQVAILPLVTLVHFLILPIARLYSDIAWDPFSHLGKDKYFPSFMEGLVGSFRVFHGNFLGLGEDSRPGLIDYLTGGVFIALFYGLRKLHIGPENNFGIENFFAFLVEIPLIIIPTITLLGIRALASIALTIPTLPLVAITHLAHALFGTPRPSPQSHYNNSNYYNPPPPAYNPPPYKPFNPFKDTSSFNAYSNDWDKGNFESSWNAAKKPAPYSSNFSGQSHYVPYAVREAERLRARAQERERERLREQERERERERLREQERAKERERARRAATQQEDPATSKKIDLFACLGITKGEYDKNPGIIKKAYRKLAMQFHPDKVKETAIQQGLSYDEEACRKKWDPIINAYDTLCDSGRASEYLRNNYSSGFFNPPGGPATQSMNNNSYSSHFSSYRY